MSNKKYMYMFFLILPILDLITSLMTRFGLLSISIGTIVKTIFLMYILYYVIFKSTSKHKKKAIIYLLIIAVYCILYLFFKLEYLNLYVLKTEIMYLIKLLYYPIILSGLVCYFDDKKIDKNELIRIININLLTYTLLLLIPLITKTSFNTYNGGLLGNIGWFYAANEISIILILIFPFIYKTLRPGKFKRIFIVFIILFTISTIGTKASMIGLIIDTFILFVLSLFDIKNKETRKIIPITLVIFAVTLLIFSNSNSLTNFKVTLGLQVEENVQIEINEQRVEERNEIYSEIKKIEKENKKENNKNAKQKEKDDKFNSWYKKYGRTLLSDRDIYFKVTYKIYDRNDDIKTILFGMGYTNNAKYNSFAIEKLIEIDPLDIFFHSGLIALVIILMPLIYYLYLVIKNRKITKNLVFYTLMIAMIFSVSCISGHTIMAPAVSIYIVLYFLLAYSELGLINKRKYNIEKNKISIFALHLNYGGVEKNICTKANILSKKYNVEIISLYKLNEKPVFELNKNVEVKYLTENIRPNKDKIKNAIKSLNIIKIIKEGLYAIKVLYLKDTLINKHLLECNSEIIISTRIDFTKKLVKFNEYNNIKIAEEHIYHNHNKRYLNDLKKILNKVDYLMPSSDYLTNYYKDLYIKDRYKIITNRMPVETDNKKTNLKNKTIISVGRLSKEKGYEDLIKTFSKTNYKDWILNIVGDGPLYNDLNNLIEKLNMKDNIKLLGAKNTKELNKLYTESSLYIMTSYEESFGLVLLEAASHGLPIIAYSSALGACEILKDDKGILIDNRNESKMIKYLNELMNDNKLLKEYQKKSLEINKKYKYEDIENYNLDFYKNATKNNIYTTLYKYSKDECYKLIEKKLEKKDKTFIITANSETYMLTESDAEINDMINNKNNLIVPDGIAVVKTARYLGYDIKERIPGVDIAEHLFELANKNKYKVYLFGASVEVIEKLSEVISKKYPNIKLVGASNGYIKDKDAVMEYIKTTNPDIVMLALGIPLQEKLINKHINDFKKGIFIGVGGSFDVLSGTKKRAPKAFILLNIEWLYRIALEPKRIKRFVKYNLKFMSKILKEKRNKKRKKKKIVKK